MLLAYPTFSPRFFSIGPLRPKFFADPGTAGLGVYAPSWPTLGESPLSVARKRTPGPSQHSRGYHRLLGLFDGFAPSLPRIWGRLCPLTGRFVQPLPPKKKRERGRGLPAPLTRRELPSKEGYLLALPGAPRRPGRLAGPGQAPPPFDRARNSPVFGRKAPLERSELSEGEGGSPPVLPSVGPSPAV